jgi:hypothetical protein
MLERRRETETMKLYHDDAFIFENGHFFASRVGKDAHYTGNGDLSLVRGGQNIWETNFVPDLASIELTTWHERGAGATNLMFILATAICTPTSSASPSRYLAAIAGSNARYPLTEAKLRNITKEDGSQGEVATSTKLGGNQVEYEDQDPRIHEMWLEEVRKNGITPQFDKYEGGKPAPAVAMSR